MTDLEQRLTEVLAQGAKGAPTATGLADAARSRARSRRRVRVAGAAGAVLLCVAVPSAVVAERGPADHHPAPSHVVSTGTETGAVPAGYRVESWHSVSVLVPDSWGYGGLADWCAGGGSTPEPRVQRPGTVQNDILCHPASTYGVTFQPVPDDGQLDWPLVEAAGGGYPDGAFVGGRGMDGVLVTVTAPSRAAGRDLLASMRPIGPEGDLNGCATSAFSPPRRPGPDAVSICRYDSKGQLEQSELLTGTDATKAVSAVGSSSDPVACPHGLTGPETVRLRWSAGSAFVYLRGCAALTLDDQPTRTLAITPDVLYWALSPGWSGSVPVGVSLPSELRRR